MTNPGNTTNWYSMSDPAIVSQLGTFLRQIRLQQNLTQEQVAEKAGLSRSAISDMENGRTVASLLTTVQVLRALKQLNLLVWREAEVMTFNNLFQIISFIFLASLCVAPFLRKVDAKKAAELPMD